MSKELEALKKFLDDYLTLCEKLHTNQQEKMLLDKNSPYNVLKTYLESIDNAEPSEALKELESIEADLTGLPKHVTEYDDGFDNYLEDIWDNIDTIKQALLKAQKPKHYLKWDDLQFSYGTKTQKVRMGDTIYKIEWMYYDNVKEVKLLSEDEKCYYLGFTGNYKDNVQLFNDLHLEVIE